MIEFDGVSYNALISRQIIDVLKEHDRSFKNLTLDQVNNRVTRNIFMSAIAEINGLPYLPKVADYTEKELLEKCDAQFLSRNFFTPVCLNGHRIIIALSDPWSPTPEDYISARFPGYELQKVVTTAGEVIRAIEMVTYTSGPSNSDLEQLDIETGDDKISDFDVTKTYSEPIAQLFATIMAKAVKMHVSDVHFKVEKESYYYMFRINGDLQHRTEIPMKLKDRVDAFMLNIMKLPPEMRATAPGISGRFTINYMGRSIDVRYERHRTYRGYHVTMRLLDKSYINISLGKGTLAFDDETLFQLRRVMKIPAGIIVMSGPTGSGKSTTLNAMLRELNRPEDNILTLENPVEDEVPGITHCDLRDASEFKPMITSFMRSDPDIILMGEVRDRDSAELAVEAAVTGHKVLTTIHTPRAAQIIERFEQLGLERWKIAQTLKAACAQRLVKVLCPACKIRELGISDENRRLFALDESWKTQVVYRAKPDGCGDCGGAGYAGRTAILEIIPISPKMSDALSKGTMSPYDLEVAVLGDGKLPSLRSSGLRLLKQGKIDLASLAKVIDLTNTDE